MRVAFSVKRGESLFLADFYVAGDFIDAAEKSGQLDLLGAHIVRERAALVESMS